MDSTTLLGLAGIGGTLVGAFLGAWGAVGAARVTSRGQADLEEQKTRREAYYTCATSLLAYQDAAAAIQESIGEAAFDLAKAQAALKRLDHLRGSVARALGAVYAEGPYTLARSAELAAASVDKLAGWLREIVSLVADGRDRFELTGKESEVRFVVNTSSEMRGRMDAFAEECRKNLHSGKRSGL